MQQGSGAVWADGVVEVRPDNWLRVCAVPERGWLFGDCVCDHGPSALPRREGQFFMRAAGAYVVE